MFEEKSLSLQYEDGYVKRVRQVVNGRCQVYGYGYSSFFLVHKFQWMEMVQLCLSRIGNYLHIICRIVS